MLDLKTDKLHDSGKEDEEEGKTKVIHSTLYRFLEWLKICGIKYVDKMWW